MGGTFQAPAGFQDSDFFQKKKEENVVEMHFEYDFSPFMIQALNPVPPTNMNHVDGSGDDHYDDDDDTENIQYLPCGFIIMITQKMYRIPHLWLDNNDGDDDDDNNENVPNMVMITMIAQKTSTEHLSCGSKCSLCRYVFC